MFLKVLAFCVSSIISRDLLFPVHFSFVCYLKCISFGLFMCFCLLKLKPISVVSKITNNPFHLCTDSTLLFVCVIHWCALVGDCPFQYRSFHSRICATDAFIFSSTVTRFFAPFKCCRNDIVLSVCDKINSFQMWSSEREKKWAVRSEGNGNT